MRAIDGDALRDRLQNLGYDDWNQGTTTTWAEAFNECADIVDETPTIEPEQRWIPCSERLPEDGQEILATTTDNAWGDVVIIRTYYKEMHKSVIAWMPLPEPYQEGAD